MSVERHFLPALSALVFVSASALVLHLAPSHRPGRRVAPTLAIGVVARAQTTACLSRCHESPTACAQRCL